MDSQRDEELRKSCTKRLEVPGRKGQFTKDTDFDKYVGLLTVECVVFPNLNDAELQNSYGVMGADALLKKMLKPGEYADLLAKVQEINGFNEQAFVYAAIQIRTENEEKEAKKIKAKSKSKGRRR